MTRKYHLRLLTAFVWLACLPAAHCAQQPGARLARNLFDLVKPMLTGGRPEKALPYLEQAMNADPEFYPAIIAAAGIHEQAGDKEKAAALYTRAGRVLLGLKKRTEKEDALLREVTAKALACQKPDTELERVIRPYLQKFREQELQAETAGKWFSALRAANIICILTPGRDDARKNIQRLARKTGPVLAAAGLNTPPGGGGSLTAMTWKHGIVTADRGRLPPA